MTDATEGQAMSDPMDAMVLKMQRDSLRDWA
jgi:hypothetical protein